MSQKQYVDNFAAPLLAELDKMKKRLIDELEVNEKLKTNQVKLEEKMKIEVEKNVTLEELIKVLTDGSDREKGCQ